MNSKKRCKFCRTYSPASECVIVPAGTFCSMAHAIEYARREAPTVRRKHQQEFRRKDAQRKKELEPRSKKYARLQRLVNQYIVHVRDAGKPCYTCGTTNPNIKYDAGHRYHAGAGGGDRRRFMPMNIHKQCSINCNKYGGGMPSEYDAALTKEYGEKKAKWLACVDNHKTLKEIFPTPQDIEAEISRYRALLRENGLKPVV